MDFLKSEPSEKLIITAAICGAEVLKEHNPAVLYTIDELVREAKCVSNMKAMCGF